MSLNKILKRNSELYSILISGSNVSPETTNIYINKSADNGTTWTLYDTLEMNVSIGDDQSLDAIIIDDTLHFVFSVRTTTSPLSNGNIYYHTYDIDNKVINGASSPFTASVFTAGHNPSIALDPSNNNIMMVFENIDNYPWSGIKKANLSTSTVSSYIVSPYLMKNPQLAITSVGGDEGLVIFYYEHNDLFSNPKIYNFSTGFKTLETTRSITPQQFFDLNGSIYVDEGDKVYIVFPSLVDNSNNDGSGSFSGFGTIVDLVTSDDLFLTTTTENIFDLSSSNYYIHTKAYIVPNDNEFFIAASTFKDDESNYNNNSFSSITLLFKSGIPTLWSGTRRVSKYSKGNSILPNISIISNDDSMHAVSIQAPKGQSKDLTYNLSRPTSVYTSILRTDFVTTAIEEEVATSTVCLLPSGSPEEYNINIPEDVLRVAGAYSTAPTDFAIHPDTGDIYVIFCTSRSAASYNYMYGGTLEVYDYETKSLKSSKFFDGNLTSLVIDPNGKLWLMQTNSVQNEGFSTASFACNVLILMDSQTLAIENRFFCSYRDSDPSDYSSISAPGQTLNTALLSFNNDDDSTIELVGDYVILFHGQYSYWYNWNDLENLPTSTDFVEFYNSGSYSSAKYTVTAPWPSIGADDYNFEVPGVTPPDWYDLTYAAPKYLPNMVLKSVSIGSLGETTTLFCKGWYIFNHGTRLVAIDLETWPLDFAGSPAEDTNSIGQVFRQYSLNSILTSQTHPSVIRLDYYYGTTDDRFDPLPQGKCSLLYDELTDVILVGVSRIYDSLGNTVTNYNGFVKINSGRPATGDPFEFIFDPDVSYTTFLNTATINKDPSRTDDLDTIIDVTAYNPCKNPIIDNCQNLWNFDSAGSQLDYADFVSGKNTACRATVFNLTNKTCFNAYINGLPSDSADDVQSTFIQHPLSGDIYLLSGVPNSNTTNNDAYLRIFRKVKYKDDVTETFYNTVIAASPLEWWKTEDDGLSSPVIITPENDNSATLYLQSAVSPGSQPIFDAGFYFFPAITGIQFPSNDWGFISNWSTSSPDESSRLALTGDMSFCAFIRFDASFNTPAGDIKPIINFETVPPATPQTIFSFGLSGDGEAGGWYTKHGSPTPSVSPDADELIDYNIIDGVSNGYYTQNFYEMFVVFTRDSVNKRIKFYINGYLKKSFKYGANPTLDGPGQISLGSNLNISSTMDDELAIGCPILFDRVLSITEIRSLYNAAKGY